MSANFTPSLNVYTDLTPFRFWCQKVLPLAYDDSLSYYELLCKVVDYLNKTMEDVSLSIEDVEKLHAAYVSLQGYVNNYFNNLDVQEEINNKLDALVADGTIHEIFTPDVMAILNVAQQASLDAIAAIPTQVSTWLGEHVSPSTGYVIDNSLTVSGAAADAKITGDRFNAVNSDMDIIDKSLSVVLNDKVYNAWEFYPYLISTTNVGITLDINTLGDSNNYRHQLIPCEKDEVFHICSYAASTYGQYALLDSNYVILEKEDYGSASVNKYVTVKQDGFLAVQGHKNYTLIANKVLAESKSVPKQIGVEYAGKYLQVNADGNVIADDIPLLNNVIAKIEAETVQNTYINSSGNAVSSNDFNITEPIYLTAGSTLYFYSRGYSTNVCLLCQTHPDTGDYFPLINSADNIARWTSYDIKRTGYYILSGNKDTPFLIYSAPSKEYPYTKVSLSMFQKFGVIGDSYASGVIYPTYGQSVERYSCSWGQIMARKFGTLCTNYSHGGLSTRTWLTSSLGLAKMLAHDPEDIYYCALGINDYGQLGRDYIGTIEDINDADPSLNADTFYGNYGKIITSIKSHAPHALIVLFTCANTAEVPALYNTAIVNIAHHYNIPYIVQAEEPFFHSSIYTSMMGGHPTSIGYGGMCNAFERLLQGAIELYPNYFRQAYAYLDN